MRTVLITLGILASAFIVALICVLPQTRDLLGIRTIAMGANIGNVLFHELGHTVFHWLFGEPAVPMIFTLFGADQAGGMTIQLMARNWVLQIAAFAALGYCCRRLWQQESALFIPAVIFSLVILGIAFTPYYEVIVKFMGHGGAVAVGGWLLYRGWLYFDARNQFERWLNAFLGFFLVIFNFQFAYGLAFDAEASEDYSAHMAFGIGDNDFQAIVDRMWIFHWTVKGVAMFTMGYCIAAVIISFLLALWRHDDFGQRE